MMDRGPGLVLKRSSRKKATARNYDEDLMDEVIEKHLGGVSKKKSKTAKDLEKETEIEAMIALSVGFPIDALLEEEIKARVVKNLGGKEQNDYIVVRNHILARWRGNVRMWLSKGQIKETVSHEYEHLISAAYDFLLYNGYINFGVSPTFTTQVSEEGSEGSEGSVIIIGAGLAGLAAARQLLSFGFKVIVLEGRNRPGGRVFTQKMGQEGKFAAVDLGGSVITGIHANPLGVLARQLSIPLHKVRDNCPLYKPDGTLIGKDIDAKVEFIFNKLLDKVTELRKIMGGLANNISLGTVLEKLRQLYAVARSEDERLLLDWHVANLEYANAGCVSNLSAAHWDQDDPYEMGGDHCFLAGGNWRLIKALCEGVPIFYGQIVDTIRYGCEGVEVIAGGQVFQADMVLCTVPLGVLKRKHIRFEPELPKRKLAAIDRLGFGLLNKVAMVFPHVFWGEDLDTFGCLREHCHQRGEFFLFYGYHTVSGGAVLIALVAGEAAEAFERTDPTTLLHRVLGVLRGIFSPKGIDVPNPIQSICTRWGSDPFSYGSYSHVRVGSTGNDYDILAESVWNRLFFAGEATTKQYPATMHGAFLSGLREASSIFQATRGRSNNSKKYMPRNLRLDILADLFRQPDMEFGNLSFVFDSLVDDEKSLGVMRITFRGKGESSNEEELADDCEDPSLQPLLLYTIVSGKQAHELLLTIGEDESRLPYLVKDFGLKLMGPSALFSIGHSLIASVAGARRGRGRNRLVAGQPQLQSQPHHYYSPNPKHSCNPNPNGSPSFSPNCNCYFNPSLYCSCNSNRIPHPSCSCNSHRSPRPSCSCNSNPSPCPNCGCNSNCIPRPNCSCNTNPSPRPNCSCNTNPSPRPNCNCNCNSNPIFSLRLHLSPNSTATATPAPTTSTTTTKPNR
ncbi:lysine-specific histone demethylase 1 homolog 2-like isoform X2 [Cucurbita maxima]|uniref:Lysine-specific histone demethylase 1 homolog 2-like isoform X2 n=1 Tax=Cucurbita maxima TaxID=3661 RepID=A0A6J1IZB6_CUCMA|nr:lysine-specific histone demethylase 1 homolog 2-like isoform X2 [Cucurbita maxima]